MRTTLEEKLTVDQIVADLSSILHADGTPVELDGKEITIPRDAKLSVVARSFHTYEFEIGFGDHYRVLVAIGGVKSVQHGVPEAGLCFATLWYSAEGKLITTDFSGTMT